MRSSADIAILLIGIKKFEFLFNPTIGDEKKLEAAASYLGICLADFQAMYFVEQKREYLRYKYLLTEFELFLTTQECTPKKGSQSDIEKDIDCFRKLADEAYRILSQNQALFCDSKKVSKYSYGISDIYKRSTHETSAQGRPEPLGTNLAGVVEQGSVMVTGAKKAGIEPGFEALLHQDIVLCLDQKYRGNMDDIRACIFTHKADMASIVSGPLSDEVLPSYMYKGDYQSKSSSSGKVGLTATDVKRTTTIQKALKKNKYYGEIAVKFMVLAKTSESTEINKKAVLEVLGNDIASIFMPTQRQTLIKTTYSNGRLKLMPKSTLLNEHEEFGVKNEDSVFAGGSNNCDNYRGRRIGLPTKSNISTVTDNRIVNGGELLIPLIFTGDYDKIGSSGQNLLTRLVRANHKTGKKEYELVGIDFGHTLQDPNPLIDNLLLDGRFKQPRQVFKNFSALSDFPFSEIMNGALKLVQMREEAEKVINDYISVFEELKIKVVSTLTEYDEVKEYDEILACLRNTKSILSTDLLKFQTKFSPYIDHLDHSLIVINLANNLNKLCAAIEKKTSLRSPDNRHGLQHLRITDLNYDTFWEVALKQDEYIFTVTLDKEETAVEALHSISRLLVDCSAQPRINLNKNNMTLNFKVSDLEDLDRALAEDNIKIQFHLEDYQIIKEAYEHLDLQDLMRAPWFNDNHLQLELIGDSSNPDAYQISMRPEEGKGFDPLFLKAINVVFPSIGNQGPEQPVIIRFSSVERVNIYKNLLLLQDNYELALTEVLVDASVDPLFELLFNELLDSVVEAYIEESTAALAVADTPTVVQTDSVVVPRVSFFGDGTLSLPNPQPGEKLIINLKEYQGCLNRYTQLWASPSAIAANGVQMFKDVVNYYLQPSSSAAILATTTKFIASYPSLHGSILGSKMLSELDDALQNRKGHILGLIEKGYNADFYAVEQGLLQKLGDDIEGVQSLGNSLSMSSSMNI